MGARSRVLYERTLLEHEEALNVPQSDVGTWFELVLEDGQGTSLLAIDILYLMFLKVLFCNGTVPRC